MKKNNSIQALILIGLLAGLALVSCDSDESARLSPEQTASDRLDERDESAGDQGSQEEARTSHAVEDSTLETSGGLELVEAFETAAAIVAAPAIWNDLLLFGTTSGAVISHDLESDEIVWHARVDGPVLSLAVGPQALMVATDEQIVALGPERGAVLWEYTLDAPPTSRITATARSLYVGLASGRVIALEPADGTLRWDAELNSAIVDRILVDAGIAYGVAADGVLYGLDASTGSVVSQWDLGPNDSFVAAPSHADGRLAAAAADGRVVLVGLSGDQEVQEAAAETNGLFAPIVTDDKLIVVDGPRSVRALALPLSRDAREVRWSVELDSQVFGSPFRVGERIVIPTADGLISLAVADGTVSDRLFLPAPPASPVSILADQALLALSDGTIVLASLDAEEGEIPLFTERGIWNLPPSGRFRLADEGVSLRMQTPREAVFDITVTAEPVEELLLRVLGPEGEEVATNMGKVELTRTVRAPLAAETPYVLRVIRPDAAGETTITIATELVE